MKFQNVHIFIGIVVLSVASAVIAGFVLVGSPAAERARQLDLQRVNDLQSISYAVDSFYNQAGSQKLPVSLENLRTAQNIYVNSVNDPATGKPYVYQVVDKLNYMVCAEFDASSPKDDAMFKNYPNGGFWEHAAGRKCYTLKVNAALDVPGVK